LASRTPRAARNPYNSRAGEARVSAPSRHLSLRFISVFLAGIAFTDLFVELAIVVYHAASPTLPTAVLAPLTFILAGTSGASVVVGLLYALLSYPAYRRTVLLLTLIVAGLLAAHLYAIDDPPFITPGAVSGTFTPGGLNPSLGDSYISVAPSANSSSPSAINLAITAEGNALASVSVTLAGQQLSQVSVSPGFSQTTPLQPYQTAKGAYSLPDNLTLTKSKAYALSVSYDYLSCYATDKKVDGCVMDEVYYVPAAQTMLSGEKCAPYADNCNLEHPFLSKAFIAAGIAIFGNGAFGWRIFEAILGTFSVPVLFALCWTVTKNLRLSLYAAFLLAFETLFFIHSSIAVIDVGAIFFGLLGFLFYFARVRLWRFGPMVLSGAAFGLAALSKETAIFLFLVVFLYNLFLAEGSRGKILWSTIVLSLSTFFVFAFGLQVYDSLFGSGTAANFIGQTEFILRYGASLTMTPGSQGWIDSLLKTPITPLNWVTYYSPVGYLVTNVRVTAGSSAYTYVAVGYYGVTNQFEVWLAYLWGAYAIYIWWKVRAAGFASEQDASDFRIARLALVWFLVVFVGYVALYLYGRITYPYYFISAVPALSIGAAYFLSRSWFPRGIAYIVLAGVFLWFFIFYPDKSFLPTQLRVWLGH
jgi:4-amino-4-deoxy-L-arabinose transferase-like glycosyltransferase